MSTKQFALIGYPLGHSMSPILHTRLMELSQTAGKYSLLEIPPEQLEASIPALKKLDGFNVTIPHKRAILPFLDELDISAKTYGAVNTVLNQNGRLTGFNTDAYGFMTALQQANAPLTGRAVVLGAGGAGRMMAIALAMAGMDVTVAIRPSSLEKARAVQKEIAVLAPNAKVEIADIGTLEGQFSLLCNATPMGMYPKVGVSPVCKEVLKNVQFVYDCVYNPTQTQLLKDARALHIPHAGGMGMLVWQAVKAQSIYTGYTFAQSQIAPLIGELAAYVDNHFGKA